MDISEALFAVQITDGYSFGKMVGIIKSETEQMSMVFSPETIEISFLNSSKCAVHKIVLLTQELTQYRYNIRDSDGKLLPQYPVAVDTNELFNTTKGIGRRDAIRMYLVEGDTKIHIQPLKTSMKDPGRVGALFVKILSMEHTRYDIPNYQKDPNVRVQAKDFADLCGQANTLKCTSLEIVGGSNSVVFKGILPNNQVASLQRFVSQTVIAGTRIGASGIVSASSSVPSSTAPNSAAASSGNSDIDHLVGNMRLDSLTSLHPTGVTLNVVRSEDLMTVRVPIATVKALSKIHNISQTGTLLRFYFAENMPTKIESPIGTYGSYVICLRNIRV